jgi:uncharacterized repeat protein (TIGR01451 family)
MTIVTTTISGVGFGETLTLEIDATATCRGTEAVGGTIQVDVASANVQGGGAISVGAQTIPLTATSFVQPILDVTKTCFSAASGPAGTVLQYAVTVKNLGNVALSLTYTESRTGTFSPAFPTSLNAGATYTGSFGYTVTGSETDFDNSITVTGNYSQGSATGSVQDSATASCSFTVSSPKVTIFKTADAGTVAAGSQMGYTITIKNTGNAPTVTPITFTDQLPSGTGLSWTEAQDQTQCSINSSGLLTCSGINLTANDQNPGGTDEFSVHVVSPTTAGSCGTYNNTANLTAGGTGAAGPVSITVVCPNVSIQKSASSTVVTAGDDVSYTIAVTNESTVAPAKNVDIADVLPGGLSWSIDATKSGSGCSIDGNGVLTCSDLTIAPNTTFTVVVIATTDGTVCGGLTNTATVTADGDTDPSDNSSTAERITVNCPDVAVEKTPDGGTVGAGQSASFTITLTNVGTGAATGVTLNDSLPTGFTLTSATRTSDNLDLSASCSGTAPLSCAFGDLNEGDSIVVVVTKAATTAADCAGITNTASVSAAVDTDSSNTSDGGSIVVNCPDVAIEKTAGSADVTAGGPVSYTITVTNTSSTATATNVDIRDNLPDGVDWSADSDSCSISPESGTENQVLTCDDLTLAPSDSFSVTVSGTSSAEACGTLSNTATVTADGDIDPSNNSAGPVNITVNCPDISVIKEADAGTVSAGADIGFLITVTNNGPGTATEVALTDTLPTNGGLSWQIDGGTNEDNCAITGGVLSCTPTSLAADASFTVHLSSPTTAATCGTVSNTATVSATNEAPNATAPNSWTDAVSVQCPDLIVTKTTDTPTVNSGDAVHFTITVTNNGPGSANNVTVDDQLPAGVTWTNQPAVLGCDIGDTGLLHCDLGSLAATASVTITVVGTTSANVCGTLTNVQVTVGASNEATTSNNSAGPVTITVNCPDIVVTKSAAQSTISATEQASFTITISNDGSGIARGASLADPLPGAIEWSVTSVTPALADGQHCDIIDGTLACSLGDLNPGASYSIVVTGLTDSADCGLLQNTATGSAKNEASNALGNNEASAGIAISCSDVTITKTPDATSVNAGESVGFTIAVTNAGTGTAFGVTLSDSLPTEAGLSWSIDLPEATGDGPAPDCQLVNGVLTCGGSAYDLGPGEGFTIHVSSPTTSATCGTVENTASVDFAGNGDPIPASASTVVNCPDVTVAKSTTTSTVNSGDAVSYTLLVSNSGPGTATNVTVTDTLPDGVDWSVDNGKCSITPETGTTGQALSCTFPSLGLGQANAITITVSGTVVETFCGTLSNQASVAAGNEAGAAAGNNSSEIVTITVNCPNVTITKVADGSPVSASDAIGFLLTVTNDGPGTATNVALSDTLPANGGLNWSIDGGTGAALCGVNSGTLSCDFGDLLDGDVITVHISSPTTADTCGTVNNTASVTAGNEPSGNQTDNSDSDSIDVQCPVVRVVKTTDTPVVNAGDQVSYTITVSNSATRGTGTAKNVMLTDNLPDGVDWVDDSASCTISPDTGTTGQVLRCDLVDLAAGASFSVTVTGMTDGGDCAGLTNQAGVTVANDAETGAITSQNVSITVNCPNVTITKTAQPGTISAGEHAVYAITVSNAGPGDAYTVHLTDDVPALVNSWQVVSVTSDPAAGGPNPTCSIDETGNLDCTEVTIKTGQSFTVTISAPTTPNDCATITNTALAQIGNDAGTDPVASNTAGIAINCSDVTVTKTPDKATVNAGEQLGFTITVINNGTGTAFGASLSDRLPNTAGLDWSFDNVTGSDANSTPTCSISEDGGQQTLDCTSVDLESSASFSVHVFSPTTGETCGPVENTATVTLSNLVSQLAGFFSPAAVDNQPAPGIGSVSVLCPSVSVQKSTPNGEISAGDPAVFDITVANTGDGVAKTVSLNDPLPQGPSWTYEITGATPADLGVTCSVTEDNGQQTLNCGPVDLAHGEHFTVRVTGATSANDCTDVGLVNTAKITVDNEAANDPLPNSASATVVVACPNLTIAKVGNGPISAGDTAIFTITVQNTGEGVAKAVSLTDALPAGVVWSIDSVTAVTTAPTSATPTCTVIDGALSCSTVDLAPGQGFVVAISGTTDNGTCAGLTNTATVDASNDGDDDGVTSAPATITVNCPDITDPKEADAGTVNAGEPIGFTITVTNNGPGTATGVTLTDPLPMLPGLAWTVDGGTDMANCSITDGTLTCLPATLAEGASFSVHLSSPTTAASCGTVSNTAIVSATNEAPNATAPNIWTDSVTIECPDVTVSKRTSTPTVNSGDAVSYTIVVSNLGAGTATDVSVTDALPDGVDWSVDNSNCTISPDSGTTGQNLSCTFSTLAANDNAAGGDDEITITISGIVPDTFCGTLTNKQVTAGASNEANTDNNTAGPVSIVVNCPRVTVEKAADAPTVSAGEAIGFTLTVTNHGPGTATNVTLSDPLPANGGLAWTIDGGMGAALCQIENGTLSCDFGDLVAGDVISVHISSPTGAATCGGAVVNTATIAVANEPTTDATAHDSTASVTVDCPDPSIEKTGNGPISAGEDAIFTITAGNGGPGIAFGMTVTDNLPAGIAWAIDSIQPALGEGQSCAITDGVLHCDLGNVAAGASYVIAIRGTTSAANCSGPVDNMATVDSTFTDPVTSDTARIVVNCSDLAVTKTAAKDVISAGDNASFTITVTNNGDGTAFGVTATDNLPAGVTWTVSDATGVDANCAITGEAGSQVLMCGPVDLTSEQAFSVTVTGPTSAANCGIIRNSVDVETADAPLQAANAVEVDGTLIATAEITVNCPDVTVEKTGNGPINAGDDAIFTIKVSNVGSGAATDVKLTDKLPTGLAWSLVNEIDGCAIADGTLTCLFDTLASGASVTMSVKATTVGGVCSGLGNTLTNTVQVTAGNEAVSATANNSDTATIAVNCGKVEVTKVVCTASTKTPAKIDVVEPADLHAAAAKPAKCTPGDGYKFEIRGDNLGQPVIVQVGKDGKASIVLSPGKYRIREVGTNAKKIFTVAAAGTTQITITNFKVTKEHPAPTPTETPAETPMIPVAHLPNTGAGPAAVSDDGQVTWMMLCMGMLMFAGAAYALKRQLR